MKRKSEKGANEVKLFFSQDHIMFVCVMDGNSPFPSGSTTISIFNYIIFNAWPYHSIF